ITTAAWRSKPSWMAVATKDRTINPDLERWYAKRANSHMVEIEGASHCVYAMTGSLDFHHVAIRTLRVPSFEIGIDGSVLRRHRHPTRFASPGSRGDRR